MSVTQRREGAEAQRQVHTASSRLRVFALNLTRLAQLVPGLVLGLFAGRLLSEWWLPGLPLAILITLATVIASSALLRWLHPVVSWPLLVLAAYVVYPEPSPRMAAAVVAVTAITSTLTVWNTRPDDRVRRQLSAFVSRKSAAAFLLALTFFAVFVATLAPGVLPADSGELQLAAAQLGVAHPPGFPLYTLLAHLMTRLPFGSPAYNVNLHSAISSAATLFFLYLAVYHLSHSHFGGVVAVLALGSATTFWAEATTANIRSLTAFFATLALYGLIRFWEEQRADEANQSQSVSRWFVFILLALSFGVSHHPSLIFITLISGLFILGLKPAILRSARHWLVVLFATLAGLLPLLYLPWRARAGARGADGLDTLDGFLEHVLALGFRGDFFYFVEPSVLWQRLLVMGNVIAFQFSPWLLLGMALGFLMLLRRQPALAFLLSGSLALHTLVTAIYRAPQTVEYMMPAYIPAAILLGFAAGELSQLREPALLRVAGRLLAATFLVVAGLQWLDRYPSFRYLHGQQAARDYARPLLEEAPPDSLILAGWHWATPLWYLQQVEGQRPDLEIHYVFPTSEPYLETWLRIIEDAMAHGRQVVATHYDESTFQRLPPPEPLGEAFLFRPQAIATLPSGYRPLEVQLGNQLVIAGYRLHSHQAAIGEALTLDIAWQPLAEPFAPVSLFAHLVAPDATLYGQADVALRARPEGLTLTQLRVTPRPDSQPGPYTLMIGAYGEQPLTSSKGEARMSLAEVAVAPSQWKPLTARSTWRPAQEGERRLVGYDWDNTLPGLPRLYLHWRVPDGYATELLDGGAPPVLPGPWGVERPLEGNGGGHYVPFGGGIVWTGPGLDASFSPAPGQHLRLPQILRSSQPQSRDLVVSIRLIGFAQDEFHWAWWDLDDSVPALGAIPSLKWIAGSTIWDPHLLAVDAAATPGQTVGGVLRLYDAFTGRPVPVLDERILSLPLPLLPLGRTTVALPE